MVEMTNEEVIYRLYMIKERRGPFEIPRMCNCITCAEFRAMGKMGLFTFRTLPHAIEVTINQGATDINSVFALEMWKLNNANTTEV